MSIENKTIEKPEIILVEGKDEAGLVAALIRNMRIPFPQIVSLDGKDKFKRDLQLFWYSGDSSIVNKLGIICDAERNQAISTHTSICVMLKKLELPIPVAPGVFAKNDNITIGTFIMPDNHHEGMLETLCLESIKENPINRCIETYFGCIKGLLADEEYNRINIPKAKMLAYLAGKVPYSNSIEVAAQKGHFDFENPSFSPLKTFLYTLLS